MLIESWVDIINGGYCGTINNFPKDSGPLLDFRVAKCMAQMYNTVVFAPREEISSRNCLYLHVKLSQIKKKKK